MNKLEKKLKKEEENQKRIENKVNAIIFPSYVDNTGSKDSFIKLKNINKIYDNNVQAVFDFNLNINQKEFIVFVGPSGCGKSTTLRMICGLEEISSGGLFIDGVYANELSPKNRDIAMVFQSYALYPHMSVYDNLAFSLKIRKVPVKVLDSDGKPIMEVDNRAIKACEKRIKELQQIIKEDNVELVNLDKNASSYNDKVLAELKSYYHERNQLAESQITVKENELQSLKSNPREKYVYKHLKKTEIDEKIKKVSKILQIEQFLNRKPKALSGGQRQRVALGRAIVRDAKVFLMDEPLSNLDAKLRVAMRAEIVDIHRKIDATTIYVTHDQTEAMTMADRIVVMKDGVVQQIGNPKDIYNNPYNLFVATFIGSPAMNILNAKLCGNHILIDENVSINLNEKVKIKEYYFNEINRLKSIKERLINALNDSNDKNKFIYEQAFKRVNDLSDILSKKVDNNFKILFGIRPEQVNIVGDNEPCDAIVKAEIVELLGSEYQIHTHIGKEQLIIKSQTNRDISVGDEIRITFDVKETLYFDVDTHQRIY